MSREIVKGERFQEILCYVFLISLCEMLLISAGVLYSVCSLHFLPSLYFVPGPQSAVYILY